MNDVPAFAVVGHVNKGKSSVISTLAEDASVEVGDRPRTTRTCRRFPVRVDGETLFELVDTPGFEEAPRALQWLRENCSGLTDRPAAVRRFVDAFSGTTEFEVERELLRPVLDGAAVLYVVDASHPYRAGYEAEMELLRWTGRPCLGVLNRLGARDSSDEVRAHEDEWRTALGQHFQTVRQFDAHAATHTERLRLLETLRELDPAHAAAIDRAVSAIREDRARRLDQAAALVAYLLVRCLTHRLEVRLGPDERIEDRKPAIERRFHEDLRSFERDERQGVEQLFHHARLERVESELASPELTDDLFAESTWAGLGLSSGQLLALYTATGAAAGLAVDAAVGGLSGFVPTLIGAGAGLGTGVYQLSRRFARGSVAGGLLKGFAGLDGGRDLRIGPHKNPNLPWIALDRALLHFAAVASRTHARRDALRVGFVDSAPDSDERAGLVGSLAKDERRDLETLFGKTRKARSASDVDARVSAELTRRLRDLLARLDDVS